MEHPCFSVFRSILEDMFEQLKVDNLYIVKLKSEFNDDALWYDLRKGKNNPDKRIIKVFLSFKEIKDDRDALKCLVLWAVDKILPEDE
jgi:hypothetical protein